MEIQITRWKTNMIRRIMLHCKIPILNLYPRCLLSIPTTRGAELSSTKTYQREMGRTCDDREIHGRTVSCFGILEVGLIIGNWLGRAGQPFIHCQRASRMLRRILSYLTLKHRALFFWERWGEHVMIKKYVAGQHLVLAYWRSYCWCIDWGELVSPIVSLHLECSTKIFPKILRYLTLEHSALSERDRRSCYDREIYGRTYSVLC